MTSFIKSNLVEYTVHYTVWRFLIKSYICQYLSLYSALTAVLKSMCEITSILIRWIIKFVDLMSE